MNGVSNGVMTRPSGIEGLGTFATRPIARGELVCTFGGRAVPLADVWRMPPGERAFVLQVNELFALYTPPGERGDGDHVNHSCEPSCGIRGQIDLVALRDLAVGEEITLDYATTAWDVVERELFRCSCGSRLCRGVVTTIDWRRPDLQERYRGCFSAPLAARMPAVS